MTPNPPALVETHPWREAARRTAQVAGVFCGMVSLMLVVSWWLGHATDPINNPALIELKAQLTRSSNDETLKTRIRSRDLQLRGRHLHYLARVQKSGWLLFGGALVLLPSLHFLIWNNKPQRRGKFVFSAAQAAQARVRSRWAIAGTGLMTAGVAWLASSQFRTAIPPSPALPGLNPTSVPSSNSTGGGANTPVAPSPAATASAMPTVDPTSLPTADEVSTNWPRFRGPYGDGVASGTNAVLTWNVQTGQGIVWKSSVPVAAPSSPVVWGNRIFLTGGTAKKREVYGYDAVSGKMLWQKAVNVPTTEPPPKEERELSSYGASTAATDGRRVYAMFPNGDLAAFDLEGNPVWARNLGLPDNAYGHASSPVVHQGRVIIQFDQGADEKEGKSRILALDALTGKEVWKTEPRPVVNSWTTPVVYRYGEQDQILASGNPWLMAYNFTNGVELWRAKVLNGEVAVSPIFARGLGLAFSANEGEKASAIKPDGTGDVTKTKVLWQAEDGLPDICSPLCDGQRFYLVTTPGNVTCYEGQTGKKLWEKDLEMSFKASPCLVGNRIYMVNDKGLTVVIQAGAEFKELARSDLADEVMASPAFANGRIYLRTKLNLFCLGEKDK